MRGCTLVWIDAREAVIVRWQDDEALVERLGSDVPAHHRSTGHVRHDPAVRHGGGGPAQAADEPRRLEHLARFVDEVAARLPTDDDLLILGPGTVREHLEHHVRACDGRRGAVRAISDEPSNHRTQRQLVAYLRHILDSDPPRRTAGAYRRVDGSGDDSPGRPDPRSPRSVEPGLPRRYRGTVGVG